MRFNVAPGTGAALANMNDNRAYYTFGGDLNQMGIIYSTLLEAGFNVVKSNVYPGFPKDKKEEYIRALKYLWDYKVEGWWNQEGKMIENGICTWNKFQAALHKAMEDKY